jgi:hypothetical protein
VYRSSSGQSIHSSGNDGEAFTRYGGIVANSDEFRSRHVHAVSVSASA